MNVNDDMLRMGLVSSASQCGDRGVTDMKHENNRLFFFSFCLFFFFFLPGTKWPLVAQWELSDSLWGRVKHVTTCCSKLKRGGWGGALWVLNIRQNQSEKFYDVIWHTLRCFNTTSPLTSIMFIRQSSPRCCDTRSHGEWNPSATLIDWVHWGEGGRSCTR